MKKISRTVFWIAITFLALSIIWTLIRMTFNLEFASDSIISDYEEFMFYGILLAILLTLFGTLKSTDSLKAITGKIFGTIALALVATLIMFMSVLTDMCSFIDKQVLYKHKTEAKTKIIVREFECGALGSGSPVVKNHKVQYFTDYFIRLSEVDTSKIDKDEWLKVF